MNTNKNYSGKNIKILDDIEAIRKYPGMYIGSVANANHLFYEILDNAIDECIMQFCDIIYVVIIDSKTISVRDNGRGIPIDKHDDGFLACELVFLRTHSGGKFNDHAYQKSGGLHGVGLSAVNALSKKLCVIIVRDNQKCELIFEQGELKHTQLSDNNENLGNGTEIIFTPDNTIFDTDELVVSEIYSRLQYISYLNPELKIYYENKITNEQQMLHHSEGIQGLMNTMISKGLLDTNYYITEIKDLVTADIIFNWSDTDRNEKTVAFTNCIVQKDGGTHVTGVRSGILRFLSGIKELDDLLDSDQNLVWNDVKTGFVLVISLKIQSPQFDSQAKNRLVSTGVKKSVEHIVYNSMNECYKRNPHIFKRVIKQVSDYLVLKNKTNKKENHLSAFLYGGRLSDSLEKGENTEIFLTEGESAGGLAKQCRNKKNQAVFTLRGKPLNVAKANLKDIIKCEALDILASALGGYYGADGNVIINECKYGKIIILVDADVDGSHIRALLMTIFYKNMKSLVEQNRLYVVVPPLYRAQIKDTSMYFNKDKELNNFLEEYTVNNYFNKLELSIDDRRIIRFLVDILNKYHKKINGFTVKIIEALFNSNIWEYDGLFNNIEKFNTNIKKISAFINAYIDSNNSVIIEDYSTLEKTIMNSDFFEQNIKNIIKIFKKEANNVSVLSIKIFNLYGCYLFEYIYNKYSKDMQNKVIIQRFKGLGEMNVDQLYETAMNAETRNLKRVVIEDFERANEICNILMGDSAELRRNFIEKNRHVFAQYDYE